MSYDIVEIPSSSPMFLASICLKMFFHTQYLLVKFQLGPSSAGVHRLIFKEPMAFWCPSNITLHHRVGSENEQIQVTRLEFMMILDGLKCMVYWYSDVRDNDWSTRLYIFAMGTDDFSYMSRQLQSRARWQSLRLLLASDPLFKTDELHILFVHT